MLRLWSAWLTVREHAAEREGEWRAIRAREDQALRNTDVMVWWVRCVDGVYRDHTEVGFKAG